MYIYVCIYIYRLADSKKNYISQCFNLLLSMSILTY